MSEAMNAKTDRKNFRHRLLASVSAVALLGCVSVQKADAEDGASQPPIWIELGGSLDRVDTSQTPYVPPFAAAPQSPYITVSPTGLEKPPGYSISGEGAISFQPDGTDWVFSASVRYGRGVKDKDTKQQQPFLTNYMIVVPFFNTKISSKESHAILDFQAGKDIGLGMAGSSTLSLGVRFAQFSARSNIMLTANSAYIGPYSYRTFMGEAHSTRSFHGIGPSIAWTGSLPVIGHENTGELSLRWGADAAILFGRQKANVQHQTTGNRYPQYQNLPPPSTRARAVTVPNVGGFAGVSYRLENVKLKLGYRADLFFGAMDGGFDTAKKENVGFYGPFVSLSVGVGR